MYKFLATIPIVLFIVSQTILGCSLRVKPLGKFDNNEFLFIGKVIGYTKPKIIPKRYTGSLTPKNERITYGLIVELKGEINLPKKPKKHFEIFDFNLGGACELLPIKLETLKKQFPLNLQVRVNAKVSNVFNDKLSKSIVRLNANNAHSLVIQNENLKGISVTSANSIFDYKSFSKDKYIEAAFLPVFEIKKDLYRLSKLKTQIERDKILERIIYFPTDYARFVDIETILKDYSGNPKPLISKFENHLKSTMTDKEFEYYKYRIERGRKQ